jgi:hypothetical protein
LFKILVTGGRDFANIFSRIDAPPYLVKKTGREYEIAIEQREFIYTTLDENTWRYTSDNDLKIIAGDARGVDYNAIQWAMINGVAYKEYKANWHKFKKAAGPLRNQQMLDEEFEDLDNFVCFAFPGDRGTEDMKNRCRKLGITVEEFKWR